MQILKAMVTHLEEVHRRDQGGSSGRGTAFDRHAETGRDNFGFSGGSNHSAGTGTNLLCSSLQLWLEELEDCSRHKNLRLRGVPE